MSKIEVFNELINYIVTCLVLNLGTIKDGTIHYNHGLQINYMILGMFAINALFILKTIIYRLYKTMYRKCVYCLGKRKFKKLTKSTTESEKVEATRMLKLIEICEKNEDDDLEEVSDKTSNYSGDSAEAIEEQER